MAPKSAKKIIVRQKEEVEEPMEVEPTASTSKATQDTPNSKKNEQPKLTNFFGKNAKNDVKQVKSAKKEQASPEKNARKSTGGKKEEKKDAKKAKPVVKREPKEENEEDGQKKTHVSEEVYEVEAVISHSWTKDGVLMYKVSWVGYEGEDTEEPESSLESAKLKVEEYLQKLPEKAREEFEGKMGRKIEVPSKGAKKRPISETIPSSSKKEPKERKIKKEEKEDEKKKTPARGNPLQQSKKDNAKSVERRSKSNAVVKEEESETLEQKIAAMKKHAKKAFELSHEDPIGGVVHSATEAMITMMRTDLNPDSVAKAIGTLKEKLEVSVNEDESSGKKLLDKSVRDAIHKISAGVESWLTSLVANERRELAAAVKEDADTEGLGALSTMGSVSGVEVKVKEEVN